MNQTKPIAKLAVMRNSPSDSTRNSKRRWLYKGHMESFTAILCGKEFEISFHQQQRELHWEEAVRAERQVGQKSRGRSNISFGSKFQASPWLTKPKRRRSSCIILVTVRSALQKCQNLQQQLFGSLSSFFLAGQALKCEPFSLFFFTLFSPPVFSTPTDRAVREALVFHLSSFSFKNMAFWFPFLFSHFLFIRHHHILFFPPTILSESVVILLTASDSIPQTLSFLVFDIGFYFSSGSNEAGFRPWSWCQWRGDLFC